MSINILKNVQNWTGKVFTSQQHYPNPLTALYKQASEDFPTPHVVSEYGVAY